jgi:glycosyltransferase involved in cell wall biosynthesis
MDNANNKVLITVCTPTYNRAKYLPRVFISLLHQERRNFEWIIVDDGSDDETGAVVKDIQNQADFPVHLHKQVNSGKHVAVNRALDLANGELFVIVDSDDACASDMLAVFEDEWAQLQDKERIAGMTFLTMLRDGTVVGTRFPHDQHIARLPLYYDKFKVAGDKCDVHRTAVFRACRFPETAGERFCPESLVWNRISRTYDTVFINKPVKVVEYLADGLSANILTVRVNSPVNTTTFYEELFATKLSVISRLRAGINYFRFVMHHKGALSAIACKPLHALILFLPAFALYLRDRRILARSNILGANS